MADDGHDPTETAVPFETFAEAGFDVFFATEEGAKPVCDRRMLEGVTGALLGASGAVKQAYARMTKNEMYLNNVKSWSDPSFTLSNFNHVFLPGGHEKAVRQVIDSERVHQLLVDYFPSTKKQSGNSIAAICHGVLVLANSVDASGVSVMKDLDTTTLPSEFEGVAYWGTRAFLGDYYKTYGHGSENCQQTILKRLGNKSQYKHSLAMGDFVVSDKKYNYLSGRFPGDAKLLANKCVEMIKGT